MPPTYTDKKGVAPHRYCLALQRELDANRWLQEELLARLGQFVDKSNADYDKFETLVRGRLLRPGLMHIYLPKIRAFPKRAIEFGNR